MYYKHQITQLSLAMKYLLKVTTSHCYMLGYQNHQTVPKQFASGERNVKNISLYFYRERDQQLNMSHGICSFIVVPIGRLEAW